jgi:hypothetical protein
VPLEGRFLLIAPDIVRIITLYVIVCQMPLNINSDGVKLAYNKSNHNIDTIIPESVEHMTTGNNMIDIKSNILVSDIFLK